MRNAAFKAAALAGACISCASADSYANLETVALNRVLSKFEDQIAYGRFHPEGREWPAHANPGWKFPTEDQAEVDDATGGAHFGRKLLQEVTAAVTDPSPENSTTITREVEKICPQIRNAAHWCDTGPWAIPGSAVVRLTILAACWGPPHHVSAELPGPGLTLCTRQRKRTPAVAIPL